MIEAIGIVGGSFAVLLGMWGLVKLIARGTARSEAASALEACLDRENERHVRSLLLVRGHLLRPDVRDAAKVWLLERENEAAEKRG